MSTDDMTHEQLQIHAAYGRILKHLEERYTDFMTDAASSPEDFEGMREDDAFVWFIESF